MVQQEYLTQFHKMEPIRDPLMSSNRHQQVQQLLTIIKIQEKKRRLNESKNTTQILLAKNRLRLPFLI